MNIVDQVRKAIHEKQYKAQEKNFGQTTLLTVRFNPPSYSKFLESLTRDFSYQIMSPFNVKMTTFMDATIFVNRDQSEEFVVAER